VNYIVCLKNPNNGWKPISRQYKTKAEAESFLRLCWVIAPFEEYKIFEV
jgi:hypothetical protein